MGNSLNKDFYDASSRLASVVQIIRNRTEKVSFEDLSPLLRFLIISGFP